MTARRYRHIRLVIPLLLGTVLVAVARQDESERAITADKKITFYRARAGGPSTYPAHARLGLAYLQKFRETGKSKYYEQGIRCLRQSLSYQQNFEALLGLAVGLSERHFFKEALPYAEEALAAMPSDLEAAGALFDIRLALGNATDAEKGLNVMSGAKAGFQSLSRLAALREYRGDLVGAFDAMTRARDDASLTLPKAKLAWAEVRLGSLHLAQGDAAKAREAYRRALAIEPGYFHATEHLAEWHAAQWQWQEAEALFRKLLKSHPAPQYRVAQAETLRQQGKLRAATSERAKAVAELRQTVRDGSQDSFRLLALLLLERKESAAAGLHWAEQDWKVRQDVLTADTLAWAYHCNGHETEALRLSERALASGAKHPALLIHGGLIRCQSGRETEGRLLLAQALACLPAFGPHERTLEASAQKTLARH